MLFFWTPSGKFLAGCPKQVSVAFKLLSTSPWEFFEENFFEKFLHLLWTFFQIISGNWAGKVWPACQNCILRIYRILLKKKLFRKTIEVFHHFQTLSRNFSASFRVFWRGCWSCILRVQNNNLTKNSFFSKFFFIFGHTDFFFNSRRKSRPVVKTGFSDSKETFGWKFFAKLTNCYFFEHRAENFWLAVRNKSAWLSSCFLPLLENILKKLFLKFLQFCGFFFQIISGYWAGKVWPACQNCILRIYKIILKKISFGKQSKFFIIFRHWAGSFRLLFEFFDGEVGVAFYVSRVIF